MPVTTFEQVDEALKTIAELNDNLKKHCTPETFKEYMVNPNFCRCLQSNALLISVLYDEVSNFYTQHLPKQLKEFLPDDQKTCIKTEEEIMSDVQATQDGSRESVGVPG